MRKWIGVAGAVAVALVVAGAAASQAAKCAMAVKEPGMYCEKCAAVLKKDEIKGGKCAKDDSALDKVQICVQRHYVCACGKSCCTDDKPRPGNCKCAKPLKEEVNNTLIAYSCSDCKASHPVKDKLKHTDACKKKEAKIGCGHSS